MSIRACHRLAFGFLLVALVCSTYVVAERHAEWSHLPEFLVFWGGLEEFSSGSWFDPLEPSHPYIWLGVAVGLLIGATALFVITRVRGSGPTVRQLRLVAAAFVPAGLGCFAYAYLARKVRWWHLPEIERAVLGSWFDPFRPAHPYLWLGLGAGLLVAAVPFAALLPRPTTENGPLVGAAFRVKEK